MKFLQIVVVAIIAATATTSAHKLTAPDAELPNQYNRVCDAQARENRDGCE